MKKFDKQRRGESGNVLFLILIAVALFAALSYAVTQSTRSGGGDATSETNLVNSAQLTQYPAGIRTAMVRMIIGGENAENLEFNAPSEFGNCGATVANVTFERCVFHPEGGGATYQTASADLMAGATGGEWIINSENEINLIGTTVGGDAADSGSADIIAFLPGISQGLCDRINQELGIASAATESGIIFTQASRMVNDGTATSIAASGTGPTIGEGAASVFDGQPYGCFQQPAGTYNYYHVLIER